MLGIAVATRTPRAAVRRPARVAHGPQPRRLPTAVGGTPHGRARGRRARVHDLRDARGPGRTRGDGGDLRPRVRDGPRRSARRVPPAAHGRGRSWRHRPIRDPGRRRAAGRVGARHPLRHRRRAVVRPAARRVRDRAHAGGDDGARRRPHRGASPPGVRGHDDHAGLGRRSHRLARRLDRARRRDEVPPHRVARRPSTSARLAAGPLLAIGFWTSVVGLIGALVAWSMSAKAWRHPQRVPETAAA